MRPRYAVSATDLVLDPVRPGVSARDRLLFCLVLVALLHLVLILGVSFDWPQPDSRQQPLDVILAEQPATEAPTSAELRAQANQLGELTQELQARPQPVAPQAEAPPSESPEHSAAQAAEPENADDPAPEPSTDADTTSERLREVMLERARGMTAAAPSGELTPPDNPRVRRISSASTRSSAEAAYINAWRNKVEQLGNRNYPAEARRQSLEGDLRVLVEIRSDGTLSDVRILDSSGSRLLDEAALRIVRQGAPYLPFPGEMRRTTDVLQIVRTWQFRRGMVDSG